MMKEIAKWWRAVSEFVDPFHLYTRRGEAVAKTIIFWSSMVFGVRTLSNNADSDVVIGSGFLMFSLAMIMEFVFMAIDREFFSNLLPGVLVAANSYVVVVSASYFTTAPMADHFVWLMHAVLWSLYIISADTVSLFIFARRPKVNEKADEKVDEKVDEEGK